MRFSVACSMLWFLPIGEGHRIASCVRLSGKRDLNPSAKLKRKESNVHSDLTFLKGIGLLELKEGKNHVNKVPVVEYDALPTTVPLTA